MEKAWVEGYGSWKKRGIIVATTKKDLHDIVPLSNLFQPPKEKGCHAGSVESSTVSVFT